MIYNFYFTPTGGTGKVAAILSNAMQAEKDMDFTPAAVDPAAISLQPHDLCIFSLPSFGGRIPAVAAEKIERITGNGAAAVAVAAFGNRAIDDTLLEIRDLLCAAGFRCIAAIEAVTEHSFVREFGAGRPNDSDAAQLREFAAKIRQKIAAGNFAEPAIPGNRPYKQFNGVPFKVSANNDCIACGRCATRCPTGAITADAPQKTDAARCITCMACTVICPRHARDIAAEVKTQLAERLAPVCTEAKNNKLYI